MAFVTLRIAPVSTFTTSPRNVKIVLPEDQREFATMVSVDCDESNQTRPVGHDWKETEIRFRSSAPQLLFVALASIDTMQDGSPRFHIHNVDTSAPVTSMEYLEGKTWRVFGKFQRQFPSGTIMIRLTLDMPRNGHADKVNLIVKDNEEDRDIPVDPLVGNDPPGTTGPAG